ncbi:zinc finger lsd1 subclass family protein (macronuclear) [Tetrahymena thermophila SB210]|uniref:Zinc finger lsd1 subclass family protein n=1 Tax=Tetrahymena thermophila (strain SB210) TaxID=312017 RepID=I7M0C4_TETTS|nr:zinc finger lsd1 subclass family protein [Tetrahymena thermophila SB210]EAR87309.2 zinc finger lsd1 subclass family protein [Tetrahymena thermophila SB210]|eukprot:XP_001007554.2 zinc finger lsd1 subclass family protein [Tetrahymena thermophila SB210]
MYITYKTWQGTKILGVTSTFVEYYSLSCPQGYFYSFTVKDCVQTCESQTYPEQNSLNTSLLPSCNPCNSSCLQCSGPLSTNCKSCPSSLPFFIVQSNQCQSVQPGTGYICQQSSDLTLPYQQNCYSCDSTCLTCSGSLPTNCLSCSQSFPYFVTSTNQCLSSPNSNFQCQQNNTTPTYQLNCQTCSPNCQTCFGPLSNNCQSCPPNLQFFNTNTNECLLQAPATGYYCYNSTGTSPSYQQNCYPCYISCLQCSGPLSTNCLSCTTSFPFYNLSTNSCLPLAPSQGYFCQQSSNTSLSYQQNCSLCDSTCLTCSGSLPTNCISCSSSFPYFNIQTNSCLSKAPGSNFYCQQNLTNPTYQFNCNICNINCLTCSGQQSNNCLSCPSTLSFFNTKTNECLLQAPAIGYYCQNSNGSYPSYQQNCYPCDPSCFQCSGPLSTNCLSCPTSLPFYNLSTNTCIASAPIQGYYCQQNSNTSLSYQQNCSPCYSTCLNCSGSLQNNCLSCTSQFPYFNIQTSSCLSNIPSSNFYCIQNLTNPTYQFNCNTCHINCLSCTGQLSNNCLSCPPSLPFFNIKTNECLVQAPASGYYCQSSSNTSLSYQQDCYPCDQSCLQCSGPISTNCLSCTTIFPFYNLQNNSCSVQAPNSGYFCTKNSNINLSYQQNCQPCDSTCLTCSGTLPTNCLSCASSFPYFNTQTNQCLSQTPGFNFNCQKNTNFPNYQFNCNSCNSNCLSCTGPLPNNCLTCPTSLPYFNTSTNECFSQIPNQGYFCQNSSSPQPSYQQNCYICDISCQNCKGPLTTDCTACSQSYPYYNTLTNTCIQQEPSGFACQQSPSNYPSYQQNCYPCNDKNCLICTNTLPNSCIQCSSNTYLYNNSCTLTKPSPAFCDNNNNCQACTIQFCLNCEQGPQTCSLCPPSFYIDLNSNQCRCPYATYLDSSNNNFQCLSCPANCAICVNSTTCQQCASNSSPDPLYPGNCILNCQSGQFYDRQTQSCQKCVPTCLTCFESNNNCLSCKTGAQTIFNQINNINECVCIDQKDTLSELTGICQQCPDPMCQKCDSNNRIASNVHKKIVWSVYQMDLNAFNVKVDSSLTINQKPVAFVNKVNLLIMKINVAKIVLINVNCVQIQVHVFNTILMPLLLGTNAILHVVNAQEVIVINAQSVVHQLGLLINKQIVLDQTGIFACHNAKFNYFNILDSQILVFSQDIPQTKDSSNNLSILVFFGYAFLSYLFIALGYLYFKIVDNKCLNLRNSHRSLVIKYFLNWNLFIKVNRISSNMILMYTINNLEMFKQLNLYSVCTIVYGILYLIFILLEVYVVKTVPSNQQLKFLTDNLNTNSKASLMFWLIAELKKIAFCLAFLLSQSYFLWAQFSTCTFILITLSLSKPYNNKRRDLYYHLLIISKLNSFGSIQLFDYY